MNPMATSNSEYVYSLLTRFGFQKIRKSRNGYTALCKFHENHDTPAFSISNEGLWMCWSCGAKGNLRHLIERLGGNPDDMGEALKIMGAALNPGRFTVRSKGKGPAVLPSDFQTYAEIGKVPMPVMNRLKYETISHFKLGQSSTYKMRGRCVIPIFYKGKPVGFHGRAIEDGIEPKYFNSAGFDIKEHIFNYDGVVAGDELIVVEGAFNAMSMWEKGFENTVATFGTKFTSDQIKKMFALAPASIVICFDRDTNVQRSGQKAAMALGELTHQLVDTYIMPLPKGKDPNQLSEEVLVSCYGKRISYDDIRG